MLGDWLGESLEQEHVLEAVAQNRDGLSRQDLEPYFLGDDSNDDLNDPYDN